jgi:hypothetical protein
MNRINGHQNPCSFPELDSVDLDVLGAHSEVVCCRTVKAEVLVDGGLEVVEGEDCFVVKFTSGQFQSLLNFFVNFLLKNKLYLNLNFPYILLIFLIALLSCL